jgi:dTDP-4-dehydrorhamnose 3,5-epimerase
MVWNHVLELMMRIEKTYLPEVIEMIPQVFADARGFFVERFNQARWLEAGICADFVQDNHSRSIPSVLRGLHLQHNPEQGKLVSVVRGKIFDVAVDVRASSKNFGKWVGVELDSEKANMLWIPPGFAHGFCVLGNEAADVLYKVSGLYQPGGEVGISWNDPEIAIDWPIKNPILSERDKNLLSLAQYRQKFVNAGVL